MARIDLSEVVNDPDFLDPINVMRVSVTVGDDGKAVATSRSFAAWGSVQPASGQERQLLPEGERVGNTITVFTTAALHSVQQNAAADRIRWKGQDYMVQVLSDYANWGSGFRRAVCTQMPLVMPDGG